MSAAEEAQVVCSRCGFAGPLHREDEVVRGCQLAQLRDAILDSVTALTIVRGLFDGPHEFKDVVERVIQKCQDALKGRA